MIDFFFFFFFFFYNFIGNLNLSLEYCITLCRGSGGEAPTFLSLALDGSECSTLCSGCPTRKSPKYPLDRRLVGSRAHVVVVTEKSPLAVRPQSSSL
jgi:hypothetical protein